MKVTGKPFQLGGVLFFPCDDGKDHTAEEIGSFHGVSGMCFYQRWNRYKDHDDPRYGCSPRHMLQTLGTEWGRELIGSDIWVQALEHKVDGKNCLIPDVRFANEAEMCRRHGLVLHVKGRGGIGCGHCSEAGVAAAPGDQVLYNDGDLAQYRAEIAALLRTIGIL